MNWTSKANILASIHCVYRLLWLDPATIADYDLAFDRCDLVTAKMEPLR